MPLSCPSDRELSHDAQLVLHELVWHEQLVHNEVELHHDEEVVEVLLLMRPSSNVI